MKKSALIHHLTQIDPEHRTAVCSVCGSVKIYVSRSRQYSSWRCGKAFVVQGTQAKYARKEANTELINEYKRRKVCKRCGYWSLDPSEYRFFEIHLPRKEKIEILAWSASRERLIRELEKRDLYCKKCYRLIRREVLLTSRNNSE